METDKGDLNDYLEGALSSDYDSEDDSDSDEAIKMGKHDSSKGGYNSDDSIDVRKANYRQSKQRARLQTSENFKRVTEKNRQVRREIVRNKNEIWYASYTQDLIVNKDAAAV